MNKIWREYDRIREYCTSRNLYTIVKTNENFYNGKQWEGLEVKGLPTPVFNVLQRCVKYLVASITTNDVSVSIEPFSDIADDTEKMKPISKEIERVIEQAKIKEQSRECVRDGAVAGSSYLLQEFDPSYETFQPMKGRIENRIVDCTNVYFGNPYNSNIQTQPWIIVALRQSVAQVKEEARRLGLKEYEIDNIKPDNDMDLSNDDSDNLVTVLLKFEKKTKDVEIVTKELDLETGLEVEIKTKKKETSVWFTKCTENVFLMKPKDLGYKRYPLSRFGWDPIKNSYLFESPMTSVIPNQVFINKGYALSMLAAQQSVKPKIVYDRAKTDIDEILNNPNPAGVVGLDLAGKFIDFIKVPDFSDQIFNMLDSTISQTKECMGVNDASLGNVKPDNTSAIIALQEGTNIPIEIQKQHYYEMWEDTVRNIIDIMSNTYGIRKVKGEDGVAEVDFSLLKELNFDLNVSIGQGAQYSEIAQVNTLDRLLQYNLIDTETYIESIPSKYIPNKAKILQRIKETQPNNVPVNAQVNPTYQNLANQSANNLGTQQSL